MPGRIYNCTFCPTALDSGSIQRKQVQREQGDRRDSAARRPIGPLSRVRDGNRGNRVPGSEEGQYGETGRNSE